MNQRGSTSAVVLAFLLFVSVLFLGVSAILELSLRELRRSEQAEQEREQLVREAERIVQLLLEDPTPFADSPQDPVWIQLDAAGDGLKVSLTDVSSFVGLNWVRKEVLEDIDVLKVGATVQDLQQFREDTGIHLELKPAFLPFISENDLDTLFTAYSYFNINVCDEFVLRKLHLVRSADPTAAEAFHAMIQEARVQKRPITASGLRKTTGEENFRLLFPVVNAEPVMNVYFVPERIMKALFAHFDIPLDRAERILALRGAAEWSERDLEELIGTAEYQGTPIRDYLGLKTWFWKIRVSGETQELEWIVARIPQTEGRIEFRLVEQGAGP